MSLYCVTCNHFNAIAFFKSRSELRINIVGDCVKQIWQECFSQVHDENPYLIMAKYWSYSEYRRPISPEKFPGVFCGRHNPNLVRPNFRNPSIFFYQQNCIISAESSLLFVDTLWPSSNIFFQIFFNKKGGWSLGDEIHLRLTIHYIPILWHIM